VIELCTLAREALDHFLRTGETMAAQTRTGRRAGCFVSLHDPHGELRGCIGTIEPVHDDLAEETIVNAISAGTRDPRFAAVTTVELRRLSLEVSVMGEPEAVDNESDLDPRRYGLVLRSGPRRGVLLPDLDGVDTVAMQIDIVRRKAMIGPDEPVEMWRFQVEKHHEHAGNRIH